MYARPWEIINILFTASGSGLLIGVFCFFLFLAELFATGEACQCANQMKKMAAGMNTASGSGLLMGVFCFFLFWSDAAFDTGEAADTCRLQIKTDFIELVASIHTWSE